MSLSLDLLPEVYVRHQENKRTKNRSAQEGSPNPTLTSSISGHFSLGTAAHHLPSKSSYPSAGPSSHVNEHNKPSLASSIPHASSHLISSRSISSPPLPSVSPRRSQWKSLLLRLASPFSWIDSFHIASYPIPSRASHPLTLALDYANTVPRDAFCIP